MAQHHSRITVENQIAILNNKPVFAHLDHISKDDLLMPMVMTNNQGAGDGRSLGTSSCPGPFVIKNKEEMMGERLGDGTADDLLYLSMKTSAMRKELEDLSEIVNVVFGLMYCNKGVE